MSSKTRHHVEFQYLDLIGWGIGRKGKREGVGERGLIRDSLFPLAPYSPPSLLFAPATQARTWEPKRQGDKCYFLSLNSDAVPSLGSHLTSLLFEGHSKEVWVELCHRGLQTPIPCLRQETLQKTPCSRRLMVKLYTPLKTQDLDNRTLFSGTYPYRPNKEVPLRPLTGPTLSNWVTLYFSATFPCIGVAVVGS